MENKVYSPGISWEEIEQEFYTPEEIRESDLRVAGWTELFSDFKFGKIGKEEFEERSENDDEMKLLGEVIELRKKLGITQKDLEKMSGIKQANISRMENRGRKPDFKTLNRLVKSMGGSIKYFIDFPNAVNHH